MLEFGWQAYSLLAAGLFFVILEVLFPSGGLLGIGSAISLLTGGWFAYEAGGMQGVAGYTASVILLAPLTTYGTLRILPFTPMGKRVILGGPTFTQREATERHLDQLVGQEGVTETPLRPAGIARIGQRRVDVITRGNHLDPGDSVRVVHVEGNRVIVEHTPVAG